MWEMKKNVENEVCVACHMEEDTGGRSERGVCRSRVGMTWNWHTVGEIPGQQHGQGAKGQGF